MGLWEAKFGRISLKIKKNSEISKPFNALQNVCSIKYLANFVIWINFGFPYKSFRAPESSYCIKLSKTVNLHGSIIQHFILSFTFKFVKNIAFCRNQICKVITIWILSMGSDLYCNILTSFVVDSWEAMSTSTGS